MVMDAIYAAGRLIVDIALAPIEDIGTNEGLREKNLRAFLENKGIGSLLLYRYYEEVDEGSGGDPIGIYTLADGRHGFVFRVYPPAFMGESMEDQIYSIVDSITINGAVLQFLTFSSQNINEQIEEFFRQHPCEVNIKNRKALKALVKSRGEYIREKSREGIFKNIDLRFRDLHNLVCVIFPESVPKIEVVEQYEAIRATFGKIASENYGADRLVTLLREFFHNEKDPSDWESGYDHMMAMNHQIVSGGVDIRTDVREKGINFAINDASYVTVLTTKEYPQYISLEETNELFFDRWGTDVKPPISGPFIASLTIVYDDVERAKERALAKQRHDLSELTKAPYKVVQARPMLRDRKIEAKEHIEFMEKYNEVPLRSMWSLILFDRDKRKLKQSVGAIKNRFSHKGWSLVEETHGNVALMEALYSLPLQYRPEVDQYLNRFFTLFKSNNSGIAPLIGDNRGFGYGHMPMMGRTGQLQWFDPYSPDANNYNMAVIGGSGSGKSFTVNDYLLMSLAKNGKIRVIDSLHSYRRITELVGGEYFEFDSKNPVCLNFFTKILTKRGENGEEIVTVTEDGHRIPVIAEDEIAAIIPIIGMMAGVNVVAAGSEIATDINTSTATRYLASVFEEAIKTAFASQGRSAGMEEVRNFIIEKMEEEKKAGMREAAEILNRIVTALSPYGEPGGTYYSYYNGVNNMDFGSDFAVVEISELEKKGQIFPIVLMTVANQIVNEFFGDEERYKALAIDEFFKFKDNLIVSTFTEELARKIRKMKGQLITITQSFNDYAANPRMAALYDSTTWKLMLSQPTDAINRAVKDNRLPFGSFFGNILKTVHLRENLFGEFAITSENAYMVSRLKTDTLAMWLYSTAPRHKDAIRLAMRRYGVGEIEAARLCAWRQDHPGASETEALEAVGILDKTSAEEEARRKAVRRKRVLECIEKTIRMKNPVLYRQPIVDIDGKIVKYEVVTRLKNDEEELLPKEFLSVAVEEGRFIDLERVIIEKAIDIMSFEGVDFSINMTVEAFLSKPFVDAICAYAAKSKAVDRMTLEVPLRNLKDEQFDMALAHAKIVKGAGLRFSNDNIDFDLPPKYLAGMPLDVVKINGAITKQLREDDLARNFAAVTIASAKRMGMQVCFLHIEEEEEMLLCRELGGELFQGHLVGEIEKLG